MGRGRVSQSLPQRGPSPLTRTPSLRALTKLRCLPALTALAIACTACNPGSIDEACRLLTRTEVESAIGAAVEFPPEHPAGTGAVTCVFRLVSDQRSAVGLRLGRGAAAAATFRALTQPGAEPVTGIGDEANWYGPFSALHVLKGRATFTVQVVLTGVDEAARRRIATILAEKMVPRLEPRS